MDSKTDILSRLYKAAKKHDADILKHFNDENLSDRNYFIYAINDDIMSNVISIILNLSLDNIESAGVDNSCRAIIEAMALLAVFNANKISDLQLKIFRCSYALVEIDNFKTILNITKLPIPKQIEEDRDRALNLFAEQFKMSREELDSLIKNRDPKKRLFLYDPLSFLMRTPKTKISYERLIKQYHPEGETLAKIYTFFSIFDHPRYEENIELELSIQEIKKTYVYMVINLVI